MLPMIIGNMGNHLSVAHIAYAIMGNMGSYFSIAHIAHVDKARGIA